MSSVSEEFLDGIYEVFSTLMTDQIFLKLLDDRSTNTNIYNETKEKNHYAPVQLVGKFELSPVQGEEYVEGIEDYVTATIPTKRLLLAGIDVSPQNYETLLKGTITYKDIDYEIANVKPRTNINDVFQFYIFYCKKPKTRR